MPIRLDPGSQMKPKSKMKVFAKDDSITDMEQSRASNMNKSARVATMLSHQTKVGGINTAVSSSKQMLDQSGDEPGRATQGVKHWGTSR